MRALVGSLAALAIAAAGCGGDDEAGETGARQTEPTATSVERGPTESAQTPEPTERETGTTELPPEDRGGGVGDEEPARSLALFTAAEGKIRPRVVRVPAFIAIRVELRAPDGREYGLRFDGRRLVVKGRLSSVSTTIDGLRPGETVVCTPIAAGNAVRIEATAEPGP
jgi:hypothetical protein